MSTKIEMRNITFRVDEELLEAARKRVRAKHTTLNAEFRSWLADYVDHWKVTQSAMALLDELAAKYTTGGMRFTRDEMNER